MNKSEDDPQLQIEAALHLEQQQQEEEEKSKITVSNIQCGLEGEKTTTMNESEDDPRARIETALQMKQQEEEEEQQQEQQEQQQQKAASVRQRSKFILQLTGEDLILSDFDADNVKNSSVHVIEQTTPELTVHNQNAHNIAPGAYPVFPSGSVLSGSNRENNDGRSDEMHQLAVSATLVDEREEERRQEELIEALEMRNRENIVQAKVLNTSKRWYIIGCYCLMVVVGVAIIISTLVIDRVSSNVEVMPSAPPSTPSPTSALVSTLFSTVSRTPSSNPPTVSRTPSSNPSYFPTYSNDPGFPCNGIDGSVFNRFNDIASIYPKIIGDSTGNNCFLRLTSENMDVPHDFSTSVFMPYTFSARNQKMVFSTSFSYRIYSENSTNHGNGMAFVIHQDPRGLQALGDPGGDMGVYDISPFEAEEVALISPALVIELDTVRTQDYITLGQRGHIRRSYSDTGSNNLHIQVITKEQRTISLFETEDIPIRTDGSGLATGRVWIDYCDGAELKVYINNGGDRKPSSPQATMQYNLTDIFGQSSLNKAFLNKGTDVFVGWTAASSGSGPRDNHDIVSWTGIYECGEFTGSPTYSPSPTLSSTISIAPTTSIYTPRYVNGNIPVDTVLSPGDMTTQFGGTAISGQGPDLAIDNYTLPSHYFNFESYGEIEVGFEVIPSRSSCSVVQGLVVFTSEKWSKNDPASYILQGRKSFTGTYEIISQGALNLPLERNKVPGPISRELHAHQIVQFTNQESFFQYRIGFSSTRNSYTDCRIAEIQLPGFLCSKEYLSPRDLETLKPSRSPHPSVSTSAHPSVAPTKSDQLRAVQNILSPGDKIERIGGASPIDRDVQYAIDGSTRPFLIWPDMNPNGTAGFEVIPNKASCTIVQGLVVVNGLDPGDDPMEYIIEGRKSFTEDYELISKGDLSLTILRNTNELPIDLDVQEHQEVSFYNTKSYMQYRVRFPRSRTGYNLMLSEVLLPGYLCPEDYVAKPYPTTAPTIQVPYYVDNMTEVENILSPNDIAVAVGGRSLPGSGAWKLNDGTTSNFLILTDPAGGTNPGFEVIPSQSGCTIVRGLGLWTGNDRARQDPTEYIIEGKKYLKGPYQLISQGYLDLPNSRNPPRKRIEEATAIYKEVSFLNYESFVQYQVTFPKTKGGRYGTLRVGEVSLPGYLCPEDYVRGDNETKAPTLVPTEYARQYVDKLIVVDNILSPSDLVENTGGQYEIGEGVENAIDGRSNKYLVYIEHFPAEPGFEVIPRQSSCTVVEGLVVYTANDEPARDPTKFVIKGRQSKSEPYESISEGILDLPINRNVDLLLYSQVIYFENTKPYYQYWVYFPELRENNVEMFQVGEIRLPGYLCPEEDAIAP